LRICTKKKNRKKNQQFQNKLKLNSSIRYDSKTLVCPNMKPIWIATPNNGPHP
jgi:hypothetical protein